MFIKCVHIFAANFELSALDAAQHQTPQFFFLTKNSLTPVWDFALKFSMVKAKFSIKSLLVTSGDYE